MEPLPSLNAPTEGYLATQPDVSTQSTPDWVQGVAKHKREANTSALDYAGAMWRQDGITDGLISHYVGNQMVPDATYSPYKKEEWAELSDGVWDEFAPYLGQATSAAHARYLKDLILQKQDDVTKLGDLGVAGNVARFAFGAVSPENLIAGGVGGLVSKGLKLRQLATAARSAPTAVGSAEAVAAARAAQALKATGAAPVVAGMTTGAAGNAAFEKLRQSVNFEDDDTAVLEAALIGLALPLPFELMGARSARKVANAALNEHAAMKVLAKVERGSELAPAELKHLESIVQAHQVVKDLETGAITPAQAREMLDSPAEVAWARKQGDNWPTERDAFIDDIFPSKAAVAPLEAAKLDVPANPTGPKIGESVAWDNPKTFERQHGVLDSVRSDGFLMVRTDDGDVKPVHPTRLAKLPPPEGFVEAPAVESGLRSGGSSVVTGAAFGADVSLQKSRMSGARLDIFATLNRSESEKARSLVFSLVKDPLQVDSKVAQGMTASEWKSHIKRTVGGAFHRESRQAAREAAKALGVGIWKKPGFLLEFHSLTTRMTRGDLSVASVNPAIAPYIQKASAAQKALYGDLREQLIRAGVKGAEDIEPNDFYVNRVWNQKAIREMMEKHGRANVHQLLANAINVPGLTGDVKKAAQFLEAVQKLEFSKAMQNMHLGVHDMGTLRAELGKHLQPHEVDLIVDAMFMAKEASGSDAGRMANLKYRFDIDENLSMATPAGELRIADLFENDARVLADGYLNSVGGHIGLAKHGIFSEADFAARIKDITQEATDKGLEGVAENAALLQDVYNSIVGRPMSTQDFSKPARIAAALRGYTRSVSLGQLGLTAAFEMKQAVGLMGMRAFMQQLPAFRGIISAFRNGYFADDILARDLEHITGFGSEMSMSYARAREIDDGFLGQQLSRFEEWSNKASHATDIMSGNASMTSLTRQLSSKMAAQRLSDFAHGRLEMSPKMRERMVGWGLDDDRIEQVLEALKKHSMVDHRGKLETIDWEAWRDSGSGTYDEFQTVNSRMVRDAIQDQDLGETMPFMHTSLGKVFAELKTFFLVAHAKNMLKNLSYMDATAAQVWAISFIGEAMAYSLQTSINYAHDPAKRDELLTPGNIGLAAFSRSPVSGMLPFFANTAYQIGTGGESLIGPDMTTSGNGRTFVPPSLQAAQRLWSAPSSAMGLVLDTGNVTQREGQDLYKTLPLSNIYGARNLGTWLTNSLPATEPQK